MPYFVYRLTPSRQLTHIETLDAYKDARALVRNLRAEAPAEDVTSVRMIFAQHRAEAEKLLSRPPDERVIGED